ncbi:phosphotransferase family [Fusarium globosum]|uniref:Phosphotransferase family n=1 Tax=Fusarium globosum TaxID=78864 RepID=A0A8H5UC42_9HYPO|nr:phosphotransferase family [Fusarium globosum]
MNSILDLTGSPASLLSNKDQTFTTSTEWYLAVAEMNLIQLAFQQNNAVEDEDDVRDKKNGGTVFRLFLEDSRPSSVLVGKDLKVVGVIDWEFAYAAPSEFSFDPPWWLLLKYPEYWPGGYKEWIEHTCHA